MIVVSLPFEKEIQTYENVPEYLEHSKEEKRRRFHPKLGVKIMAERAGNLKIPRIRGKGTKRHVTLRYDFFGQEAAHGDVMHCFWRKPEKADGKRRPQKNGRLLYCSGANVEDLVQESL